MSARELQARFCPTASSSACGPEVAFGGHHYLENALDALIGEKQSRFRDLLALRADRTPKAQTSELAGESGGCIEAAGRLRER